MKIVVLFLAAGLAGCSAHSPFILTSTTDVQRHGKPADAHSHPLLVTKDQLPAAVQYKVLADIDVGTVWYGRAQNVWQELADKGRELGADAVVDVHIWFQPSGWAWAAPHGSGKAIKIVEPSSVDLERLQGDWL